MSHFTVLVFTETNNEYKVDANLAKYSEHIKVEPYVEFTKEEAVAEAKRRNQENIKYYKKLLEERKKEEVPDTEMIARTEEQLANLEEKASQTDKQFYKELTIFYGKDMITENGDLLSTYNPDSKWDWYCVGGRWSGEVLRTKDGMPVDEGYAKDLDFSQDEEMYTKCLKWWKDNVEGDAGERLYKKEYYVARYKNAETFAAISSYPHTRAVVTPDGEWHEPGKMGYFGLTSETEEEGLSWDLNFRETFIEPAIRNNWYVTLVDCHI